mgnify:CR=1 FL=1
MILINKEINIEEIIKTIRIFEKNNKIHLDYRVNEKYIINGKERCRFSLGIDITEFRKSGKRYLFFGFKSLFEI